MTRLRYGTVASLAGAAFAIYNWWRRRPDYVARQMSLAGQTQKTRRKGHTAPTRTPVSGAVV